MLPDRDGQVRIRANVAGAVEIRASVGQVIVFGQILAIVEGDQEIESLSVRHTSEVLEILVADGAEVPAGTTLMVVRETDD
jgi:biotin carboxyl carrier protein